MNRVILFGRLTKEPELRYSQGGGAVAIFTLAIDRNLTKEKRQEAEARGQQTADFIRCKAFGRTAELAANNLDKGLRVGLEGSIQTGSYENKEGRRVYTTDVLVHRLEMVDWKEKGYQNQLQEGQRGQGGGYEDFVPYDDQGNIPF